MNRRQFIQSTALAATAAATLPLARATAQSAAGGGVHWPIGIFNRPWEGYPPLDTALDGAKAAGYGIFGLLTPIRGEPFLGAPNIPTPATPEYIAGLKKRIADRGLKCNMGSLWLSNRGTAEESITQVRKQIDNAKTLDLEFLLTFGVDSPARYDIYYQIMKDAAAYSQERGIKLVLKPHGGGSGAAEEILRCMEKVGHPNFKVWYDAGNIIYYTGKDPIEQLKPIVQHVTGFCAKDCARPNSEVFLEFGKGKVDFAGVFTVMKQAGFNGPIMVECCAKGANADETTAGARKNREFLEKVFASI